MAQIRLVDDWLRSPAAQPSHCRSVMVIAEKWAEQRVLMRAYSQSRDQTLPTIMLHGVQLAISPAGLDVAGPWGIHVDGNAECIEARAASIRYGLEEAARRLAGSRGNPPRLLDEESAFDLEQTNHWASSQARLRDTWRGMFHPRSGHRRAGSAHACVPGPIGQFTPQEVRTPQTTTRQHWFGTQARPHGQQRVRNHTVVGYASGFGAQSALARMALAPPVAAQLGWLANLPAPQEFYLDADERIVLNALGERSQLTARDIELLLKVADGVAFMVELRQKLARVGIDDLVEPAGPADQEPRYRMRR